MLFLGVEVAELDADGWQMPITKIRIGRELREVLVHDGQQITKSAYEQLSCKYPILPFTSWNNIKKLNPIRWVAQMDRATVFYSRSTVQVCFRRSGSILIIHGCRGAKK